MKKRLLFITLSFCLVCSLAMFAACENQSNSSGGDINLSNSPDTPQECIHEFSEWQIVINATCSKVGERSRKCSLCDFSETEEIGKLSHTEEVIPAVEATCYKEGSTEGKKCSVCNEVLIAPQSVAKTEHNYANGICINEGCGAKDPNYNAGEPSGNTYTIEGDYVYFGSYPQTKVEDSSVIAALNSAAGDLPTSSDFGGWTNYEYYISSSNSTAFMWYKDISYENEKYRGVYFTNYRPYWTSYSSSADYTFQDDNGYELSTCYWFKYEPLKWRILTKRNGKAFLLCDIAIDSQEYYDNYDDNRSINGETVYANNYAESNIRAWLNDNFYNTAFSQAQQALIQTTLVDNSARSTNPNNNATYWNNGVNTYACADTNDKVFLLSEQEITNSDYGFNGSYSAYDPARRFKSTDYAKCQGCYRYTRSGDIYDGNGPFWLRSPYYSNSGYAWYVGLVGDSAFNIYVYSSYYSVVPALWLDLSE